jgi:type I restriction enzyme S subunit
MNDAQPSPSVKSSNPWQSVMQTLPPGYKQTDVGVIPEDWELVPLRQLILSVEYGSSAKSNVKGDIPVLRMGNLQDGELNWSDLVYTNDESEIEKYALDPGDVLFNRTNTIDLVGKTSIYRGERPAIFAGYLIRIKVDPSRLDSEYLNFVLNAEFSKRHSAKVLSVAVAQANINGQKVKTYPIPLPPTLTEQQAIAEALSDIDALIGALDRLIAKKRAIKQGAMQELLTGRRRLPGFDGEWENKSIGNLFQFLRTANNPRSDLTPFGTIEYLHYGDVHTKWKTFLDCERVSLPLIDADKVRGIPFLEDGDLVMVDASEDYEGVGVSLEIKNASGRKIVAGLHTLLLRANKADLADVFKGYLQYIPSLKRELIKAATGISVYGLLKRNIEDIQVLLPNVDEQAAIAATLSDMDAEIAALERRRDKTTLLKQGMMQELLTGKIRLM